MEWNLIGLWCSGLLTGASFGFVAGWLAWACLNRRFGERGSGQRDGVTTVVITSGTSWTVPSDWNSASNSVACYGAGG